MPGFTKQERLLKRADFLRVSASGEKVHTSNFLVLCQKSAGTGVRLGITVSGKVGNAVIRNRLKRLVREFFRHNKALFSVADYNIIAKKSAARLELGGVSEELEKALRRLPKHKC